MQESKNNPSHEELMSDMMKLVEKMGEALDTEIDARRKETSELRLKLAKLEYFLLKVITAAVLGVLGAGIVYIFSR